MLGSSMPRFGLLQVRDYKFDPEDGAIATLVFDGLGLFIVPDTVVRTAQALFFALCFSFTLCGWLLPSECKVRRGQERTPARAEKTSCASDDVVVSHYTKTRTMLGLPSVSSVYHYFVRSRMRRSACRLLFQCCKLSDSRLRLDSPWDFKPNVTMSESQRDEHRSSFNISFSRQRAEAHDTKHSRSKERVVFFL
jgi:hypothetical protein